MESLTATMRELVFWKNLDNCGCHSRSGLHFSNAIGHIIHSQSPRRGLRGSQQQTHTSKSQKGLPKSPSINLLECRSHQQGQPKERKKSLSARVSRKKKKACWHSLEERRLRCGRKLDRREPFGPPLEETRKQLACQIPFGEALASTNIFKDALDCSPGSVRQVSICGASFPVTEVCQHSVQHGLRLFKQLHHGLEQRDSHNVKETQLQAQNSL